MFSGKYSILTCSFSVSLVSLKQQTTFPSAASWVIVLCQCFVNLSIAHTQFTNILMAQLSMYGLTEKPIPLECRWIWQPCLSKLSLCLRREREREREFMGDLLLPLWQFWFWQNFFEYRMPTSVETQMNGTWVSIFHSKFQVFPWGRADLMPWAPTSSKVPIFHFQLVIHLFHMNWFLSYTLW